MFATLLGTLPRPPSTPADGDDETVRAALAAQESAGIELLSDGGLRGRPATLADWQFAAGATERPVKQTLIGPYTAGAAGSTDPAERRRRTLAAAEALNSDIHGLRDAGCTFVQIDEPAAVGIGADRHERALFGDAHRRLTDGIAAIHLSLAIGGGSADEAGAATFFDLPYASYAFDLIAGPDNWRLIAQAPGDRGIVCGALDPSAGSSDGPETLVWAAHYAASTGGRGLDRVGLANASSLGGLERDVARRKVTLLAEAARLASASSPDELARGLDPRAVDIRSAALGRPEQRGDRGTSPRGETGA
jgi:methionine synthase II (cobalamin-independent)